MRARSARVLLQVPDAAHHAGVRRPGHAPRQQGRAQHPHVEEHWDELIPQAELPLNLMRSSGITTHLSAWHQLHGAFNYNQTPIAPPGMRVVVHEKPDKRPSWGYHGLDGFYVGPALGGSYRCFTVFVTDTRKTRINDTLSLHPPAGSQLSGSSPTDAIVSLLAQVETAITALANSTAIPTDQRQLLHAVQPNVSAASNQFRQVFHPTPNATAEDSADNERVQLPSLMGPPPGLTLPPAGHAPPSAPSTAPFAVPAAPAAAVNPAIAPAEQQRVPAAREQRVPHENDTTSADWSRVARRKHQKRTNAPQTAITRLPRVATTASEAPATPQTAAEHSSQPPCLTNAPQKQAEPVAKCTSAPTS
jgi:hypothetical protein